MPSLTPRWTLCLSGLLLVACAVGAAVWQARRPAADASPPPLPDLSGVAEGPASSDPDPKLDESERQFLWDVEHHGNLLNAHGFRRLADALQGADPRALADMLAEDFAGALPH